MLNDHDVRVERFIVPGSIFPSIPPKTLELFNESYWDIIEQYLLIFCFAENWDDINGFFENWLFDHVGEEHGEAMEMRMLEGMTELMEIYGDFSEVLGRTLHSLRNLPPLWGVMGVTCKALAHDVIVLVTCEKHQDPEDAYRPDIYSPTANVAPRTYNPNQPKLYNFHSLI
tara:strand:- start:2237 stop:2749 length:513 start_codon:yes stop_codon:yes gene_type:complete